MAMVTVTQEKYVEVMNRARRNRRVGGILMLIAGCVGLLAVAYLEEVAEEMSAAESSSELRYQIAMDRGAAARWQQAKEELRAIQCAAGVGGGALAVIGLVLLATMPPKLALPSMPDPRLARFPVGAPR